MEKVKTEGLFWLKREGRDKSSGEPTGFFDTLVWVDGDDPDDPGFNSTTVHFLVSRGQGKDPIRVSRLVSKTQLRPFVPGDIRLWHKMAKPRKEGEEPRHYSAEVAILGLDEETGCVLVRCVDCPHDMQDGAGNKVPWHRVNPRYLENKEYRTEKPPVAHAPAATETRPAAESVAPGPAATVARTATATTHDIEVLKRAVAALVKGGAKAVTPEDADYLDGTIATYPVPTKHFGKASK